MGRVAKRPLQVWMAADHNARPGAANAGLICDVRRVSMEVKDAKIHAARTEV